METDPQHARPVDEGKAAAADTPGGQKPEKVEDRPFVGEVKPEDYPEADRADSDASGKPADPQMEEERRSPGVTQP